MTMVMSWAEWFGKDGLGLAELVKNGEVTASELAAQAATAIKAVNPQISGVVEIFEDAVSDATVNGANPEGAFAGLPFLLKDLGPTLAGRLQEQGSLYMKGNRPTSDTFLTTKMKAAGLNIIGRTTTPEFGCCSSAENPALYVTRNPWNTDFTSCGSSAGSAVMVGAGVVPLAHATTGDYINRHRISSRNWSVPPVSSKASATMSNGSNPRSNSKKPMRHRRPATSPISPRR